MRINNIPFNQLYGGGRYKKDFDDFDNSFKKKEDKNDESLGIRNTKNPYA